MALRKLLTRASVRASRLVPVEKRLRSNESKLAAARIRADELGVKGRAIESTIESLKKAILLSDRNEAEAKQRLANSTTDRETSEASADMREAAGLSKRNSSALAKATKQKVKAVIKFDRATQIRNDLQADNARLVKQVEAAKSAAPTRKTRVRRKTLKLARATPGQIRTAKAKVASAKADFVEAKNELVGLTGRKPNGFGSKRRNKFN